MKIIKGHLPYDSWGERLQFSKKFPSDTKFDNGWRLCFWSALDAQPCFEIDDDAKIPENTIVYKSEKDETRRMIVNNITDITSYVTEISNTRDVKKTVESTNGYIAI